MNYKFLTIDDSNRESALKVINSIVEQAFAADAEQLFDKYPYKKNDLRTGMMLIIFYSDCDTLIGFGLLGIMESDTLYLHNIYINKQHRSGALLMVNEILCTALKPLRVKRLMMFVDVNAVALLYRFTQHGWRIAGKNLRGKNHTYDLVELTL
ncbi:MAG: hypothetical protein WC778_08425 [Negativicutes bacterium]